MRPPEFYQRHLDAVSRSFALCIPQLDQPLRELDGKRGRVPNPTGRLRPDVPHVKGGIEKLVGRHRGLIGPALDPPGAARTRHALRRPVGNHPPQMIWKMRSPAKVKTLGSTCANVLRSTPQKC